MEILFLAKLFNIEFLSDLFVLSSPEFKKSGFQKLVYAYVCECMCVSDCVGNIQRIISPKLIEIDAVNFLHGTK